ncbi:unnamed protein product [Gongylonema pulchrum]|uniref:DNA-directed DNA polymerase n=1 Tax=Gongylonema pulchrum TaxID=637853 RepID=A0A183E5M9_9BILA|nr:unnamed protein product [Gongylonema pulchrum]
MCSPETLPLTMEPESGFYRDPVIVLDFQSLYPSIIIAYNYCFTTCLGKVLNIENVAAVGKAVELGGLSYCCPRLARILDARQLALKLIANVTYGYAAANFSGRMPCVEVADAIVSKGRETLERAIEMVNNGNYGGARVVYGDTDSMFVLCPGSSRAEAFEIGRKIADDVTNANPNPVKLKLEKIMHPLILESKKRYVGMSYESINEDEGIFDAVGIETVRRDSCPLVSRVSDMSRMVRYLDMQLSNLDKMPVSDFVFSREYRKSYAESAVVASKLIAE